MSLMSQVKIIATIGPGTNTPAALKALLEAGANVARLNGSHADLEWHAATIKLLREVVPHMPILLDIPGRKIRTGALKHEPCFQAGDSLVLTTSADHNGHFKVPVSYPNLHEDLSPGDTILADDGQLRFTVEVGGGSGYRLQSRGGWNAAQQKGHQLPWGHVADGDGDGTRPGHAGLRQRARR